MEIQDNETLNINIVDADGNVMDTLTIPIGEQVETDEVDFAGLLNPSFCRDFREAINASPIFCYDPKYMARYHLSCAVMDRLDTCIEKLNTYGEYPESEEDFLVFMMFASMATDAVKEILAQLGIHKKKDPIYNSDEDYKYFREAYLNSTIYNPDADIPTDEEFFQHFRSLSFAHPAETSRQKFLRKNETQYSPWVIVNRDVMRLRGYEDEVGVRIYTSLKEDILDLRISFGTLKEYVKSRYERISLATKWVYEQIESVKTEWRKTKINREQAPVDVLREIDKALDARFERTDSVKEAIRYMECELSNEANRSSVEEYRNAIIERIPALCDAVDNLDHELAEELCYELYKRPWKMHQMAGYQLEKIFCNLGEYGSSDVLFGLRQAQCFSEGFAKKWVNIDVNIMSHTEIRLLVRTACYLERRAQEASSEAGTDANNEEDVEDL